MNRDLINLVICPQCNNTDFSLTVFSSFGEQILEGTLTCVPCNDWFRIENGIVDLLPTLLRQRNYHLMTSKRNNFAQKHNLPIPLYKNHQSKDMLSTNKTKPTGVFEDVDDYEKHVVNLPYYKALDKVIFHTWIEEYLNTGDLVLDIGCGSGSQCIPLAEHQTRIIGIDIDEDMLLLAYAKVANKSKSHFVDFIIADGQNPPVRNQMFNACVLYGVLHHLSDKKTAIDNVASKLIEGGHFFSLDPNKSKARFLFDLLMKYWKLYVEEASDDPLITRDQLLEWTKNGKIVGTLIFSTYLPPHLFCWGDFANMWLLKISDYLLNQILRLQNIAGVIIFNGTKQK